MRRILTLGENAIDIIVELDELILEEDKNNLPVSSKIKVGGTGINFVDALSKLNEHPVYFTPISKDAFGKSVRDYLEENNINYFDYSSNKQTPFVINIIQKGIRHTIANIMNTSYTDISFDVFVNANLHYEYAYVSGGLLTEENPQKEVLKIIKFIKLQEIPIFFDPQVRIGENLLGFKETVFEMIDFANIVFANEVEINYFPKEKITNFLDSKGILVVKRGSKGAKLFTSTIELEAKGIPTKKVNPVGAGDVFNAAFIKAYIDGMSLKDSLNFANSTAANFVERGLWNLS